MKVFPSLIIAATALLLRDVASFSATTTSRSAPVSVRGTKDTTTDLVVEPFETKDVVTKVAVAGATGRTGRLVVEELLNRGVQEVVAIVRDTGKASEVFPDPLPSNLEVVKCDLTNEGEIESVLDGADAAIWCATGFSDAKVPPIEKLKRLFGVAVTPKRSVDAVAVPCIGKLISSAREDPIINGSRDDLLPPLPKVVMLSSAGVTRPTWDDEKKERFRGAADIPIVRLNPFGILDIKRESEEKLRETGVDYCIVRPAGLNDEWPAGSRPILSQGDVAVGRINRKDVASILVDVLTTPEAAGKTFEVMCLSGYPKGLSVGRSLANFHKDSEGPLPLETVAAAYSAMQQLLPGEKQDSARLAMGQTYEQLDAGKEGRFGQRGKEDVESAAPKPS